MKNVFKKMLAIISVAMGLALMVPTVIYAGDTMKPVVGIYLMSSNEIYAGESVTYEVRFVDDEEISKINLTSSNIILNGFSANISVSGTGNIRTVKLTNIQGTVGSGKTITVKGGAAIDTSGNLSTALTSRAFSIKETIVTDTMKPVVGIYLTSATEIYAGGTITYEVRFTDDEGVTQINLSSSNIGLNGFSANVSVSGTGNTRIVTLTNVQGTVGTKSITVKAGAAKDAAGNLSSALTSRTFSIKETPVTDTMKPVIGIYLISSNEIYAGETVKYEVRFTDDEGIAQINLTSSNIILNGFSANVSVSGTGNTRVVTLTNVQGTIGDGKSITVKAGAAVDTSGNLSSALTSRTFTILQRQAKDTIPPVVSISSPNPSKIYSGGKVVYTLTFRDNIAVTSVNLVKEKIKLNGFTADISIKVNGIKSATVTLTNIKGTVGVNKYITVYSGVAIDKEGNRSAEVSSPKFTIMKKSATTIQKQVECIKTQYVGSCVDDLRFLGDINKEITYFASWLKAEKYTASYVQENNYAAEDETMTYMVEYYNGSTAPAPNVKFDLTIPYKVVVEEINGNGKITKQTENETVITWNMGKITSGAHCRLYVRVRFLENTQLENSKNISEVFYPVLKTTASGNTSYSYLRQLFIDTTEGKTGTYKKYLTSIDTSNSIRPDDEITRAEFAKLLADSGIIEIKAGSDKYKTFKDAESIPAYARDAVSALIGTDIIQAFPDGTFKPSNPILMEDVMQMLAQAATYISEQKLSTNKAVFLYTDVLTGSDKKLSDKKDYIMELMRQNVVVKYESNPDSYALRKDVVSMVNSLTFRGPYVEKLPENTYKFADIRDDSIYFYNIVGASNSYTYTYDYRLWQEIAEIN